MTRWLGLGGILSAVLIAFLMFQPSAAYAYVGPSAGLSLFSAATGLFLAFFSALAVLLMWPIRMLSRLIRGDKTKAKTTGDNTGVPVG